MARPEDLSDAAYAVADEYRVGAWPDLKGRKWREVWRLLMDELRRRCEGFTDEEYSRALNRGFFESR